MELKSYKNCVSLFLFIDILTLKNDKKKFLLDKYLYKFKIQYIK